MSKEVKSRGMFNIIIPKTEEQIKKEKKELQIFSALRKLQRQGQRPILTKAQKRKNRKK